MERSPNLPRWNHGWNSVARYLLDNEVLAEVSMSNGRFFVTIESHRADFPDAASAKLHVEQIVGRAIERAEACEFADSPRQ